MFTGVHHILVALMAAKAEVQFDPARVLPNQIANSITDLGFPSTVIEDETGAGTIELEVRNITYTKAGVLKIWTSTFLMYFGFLNLDSGNQIWKFIKFIYGYFGKFSRKFSKKNFFFGLWILDRRIRIGL